MRLAVSRPGDRLKSIENAVRSNVCPLHDHFLRRAFPLTFPEDTELPGFYLDDERRP